MTISTMIQSCFMLVLFTQQTNAYSTPSSSVNKGPPIRPSFISKSGNRYRSTPSPPLFFAEYENNNLVSSRNIPRIPTILKTDDTQEEQSMSIYNQNNNTIKIGSKEKYSSFMPTFSSVLESTSDLNMNIRTPKQWKKSNIASSRRGSPSPLFFADEITYSELSNDIHENTKTSTSSQDEMTNTVGQEESTLQIKKPFGQIPSFMIPEKKVPPRKKTEPTKFNIQSSPLFFADEIVANDNLSKSKNLFEQAETSLTLEQHQKQSIPIASSFQPKEYNPHPLLTNKHVQTILGVFIRDEPGCAYIHPNATNIFEELFPIATAILSKLPGILGWIETESECSYWDERERIRTNDGDFFDVDYKYALRGIGDTKDGDKDIVNDDNNAINLYTPNEIENDSEGLVIIVHGLESNSNSSVCTNMAKAFHSHNFDVACINFRGCSGVPNDTIYQYHGGFTHDVKHYINLLTERRQQRLKTLQQSKSQLRNKPLYISGFSLGSNIVMKCLGELSFDAVTKHNLQGAAVTAAPFHLRPHHRQLIDEPFQRNVYARSLLKSMKSKVDYLVDSYCDGNKDTDKFDYWMVKNATTIAEVEDGMIAPLYGFKDKFDYFDKSASLPLVDDIAVPTFVLNAADDPFFSPTFFPWGKDCDMGGVSPLKLVRTTNGGHLGHLFHRSNPDEKVALSYQQNPPVASFALSELGRFINHVHTNIYPTKSF